MPIVYQSPSKKKSVKKIWGESPDSGSIRLSKDFQEAEKSQLKVFTAGLSVDDQFSKDITLRHVVVIES